MKVFTLLLGDIILLYAALATGLFIRYLPSEETWTEQLTFHLGPFSLIFILWLLIFGAFGLYDLRFIKNSRAFLYRLSQALATNLVLAALAFYTIPTHIEPRRNLLIIVLITALYFYAWRYIFNLLAIRTRASRVLFLGVSEEAVRLADYLLKNPQLGHRPVGFISKEKEVALSLPHFSLQEKTIRHIFTDTGSDIVVISPEAKHERESVSALFQILPLGVSIIEFPSYHEMLTGKVPLSLINEVWFLENLIGQIKEHYEFTKRVIDLLLSLLLGTVLIALLPFIALFILISTPKDIFNYKKKRARSGDGLIFFRQKRVGKNGEVFDFIKFRTYVLGAEKMSEAKEVASDKRKYFFGSFLRKSYLDELPQIWNVLKGEMSFIGPRPERPEYVEELKKKVPFYEMRLLVPPGITGWAQTNMENDASVEDAPEKMQYDLYYIKNRSVILDLLIGLRTVFAILGRTGR